MKTKVHKVTVLVVDHDDLGAEGVKRSMEAVRYPNHCMSPSVMGIETAEIEWDDNHPLNYTATVEAAFRDLFKNEKS